MNNTVSNILQSKTLTFPRVSRNEAISIIT